MQGFGGLLRLVPIAVEALLSVTTAALSGFGLFFRVSFGLGHDALLRIVIISLPDIKETMSHLVSISSLQTSGDTPVSMRAHKPFIMHNFHGVPSGRQGQFSLKFTFGKARSNNAASVPCDVLRAQRGPPGTSQTRMHSAAQVAR